MATRHEKITKRLIDSLTPLPDSDLFIMDTDDRGFGFRLKPSGAGSYFVKYWIKDGPLRRDARHTIADRRAAPDEARAKARTLLAQVALGADPSAKRREERAALTVEQLCEQYLEAARAGLVLTRFGKPKRASTVAIDEGRVSRHIAPTIGGKVADKLTSGDVQRMVDAITKGETAGRFRTGPRGLARVDGGAGTAARVVELLGGIWTWAGKRELVSSPNPARGVDRHRGDAQDRVLSPEELARLGAVMRRHDTERPMAVVALRLIALTGLRREEACGLRWREVDAANSCLRLESTKTGKSFRPIGATALEVLGALPRSSEFVFPNRDGTGSAEMKKKFAAIFDAAGLSDARAHDLRRTFATRVEEEGYSSATAGELLGHARRGVTEKHYIRRPDAALIAAADRVSARIAAALDTGMDGAEVVPFKRSSGAA